jgi:hypothetical protein
MLYKIRATIAGFTAGKSDKCQVTMTKDEYKKLNFTNPLLKSNLKAVTRFMGDIIDVRLTFSPLMLNKIDGLFGKTCVIEISPNFYSFDDPVTHKKVMGYKFFISTVEEV